MIGVATATKVHSMPIRFRLKLGLVPGPLWCVNLRSSTEGLGDYRWRKLRKQIVDECGGKCVICGSDQRLHGHEVWRYVEKKRVGSAHSSASK